MLKTLDLYDLNHTQANAYLSGFEYPWQALSGIKDLILSLGPQLGEEYTEVTPQVWVHKTATVALRPIWVRPASSVLRPKCGTALSSVVLLWWAKAAWLAILWN